MIKKQNYFFLFGKSREYRHLTDNPMYLIIICDLTRPTMTFVLRVFDRIQKNIELYLACMGRCYFQERVLEHIHFIDRRVGNK